MYTFECTLRCTRYIIHYIPMYSMVYTPLYAVNILVDTLHTNVFYGVYSIIRCEYFGCTLSFTLWCMLLYTLRFTLCYTLWCIFRCSLETKSIWIWRFISKVNSKAIEAYCHHIILLKNKKYVFTLAWPIR